jgi:hypothetical protein
VTPRRENVWRPQLFWVALWEWKSFARMLKK